MGVITARNSSRSGDWTYLDVMVFSDFASPYIEHPIASSRVDLLATGLRMRQLDPAVVQEIHVFDGVLTVLGTTSDDDVHMARFMRVRCTDTKTMAVFVCP